MKIKLRWYMRVAPSLLSIFERAVNTKFHSGAYDHVPSFGATA